MIDIEEISVKYFYSFFFFKFDKGVEDQSFFEIRNVVNENFNI